MKNSMQCSFSEFDGVAVDGNPHFVCDNFHWFFDDWCLIRWWSICSCNPINIYILCLMLWLQQLLHLMSLINFFQNFNCFWTFMLHSIPFDYLKFSFFYSRKQFFFVSHGKKVIDKHSKIIFTLINWRTYNYYKS